MVVSLYAEFLRIVRRCFCGRQCVSIQSGVKPAGSSLIIMRLIYRVHTVVSYHSLSAKSRRRVRAQGGCRGAPAGLSCGVFPAGAKVTLRWQSRCIPEEYSLKQRTAIGF